MLVKGPRVNVFLTTLTVFLIQAEASGKTQSDRSFGHLLSSAVAGPLWRVQTLLPIAIKRHINLVSRGGGAEYSAVTTTKASLSDQLRTEGAI